MFEATNAPDDVRDDVRRTRTDLVVDGRTARRNRNKDAVLDAMIALTREQSDEPSVESIADRAGVSYRSVYRYFEDRTDLMLAAIGRVMGDVWPVFDIDDLGSGPLDDRIRRFIDSRIAAYHELAPLTRLAIRRSVVEASVMVELDNVRSFLRHQLADHFRMELERFDDGDRALVVAALDVMFQFESLEHFVRLEGMSDEEMAQVLTRHIHAHLATAPLQYAAN